jgi:hypothetical protein
MQTLLSIFIFCIVLFFYLHIYFHLKTSDDLEVYEIYNPSKDKLEEICDLRQPVIFDYDSSGQGPQQQVLGGSGSEYDETRAFRRDVELAAVKQNYGAFDVKVKNTRDLRPDSEPYIPLTLSAAHQLMKSDTASKLISEKNTEFLEETGLIKRFQHSDDFLRPPLVSNCDYDYTFASEGVETQLQYSVYYRNYFMPIGGRIKIIMIPPKSSKYLYAKTDYEAFEFLSPVSPWRVQDIYKADYAKIKTLEVQLVPGKIAFIPAYWWYSIKYLDDATLCTFKYRTYMNTVSILPPLFLHFLQRQNVKRSTVKQVAAQAQTQAQAQAQEPAQEPAQAPTLLPASASAVTTETRSDASLGTPTPLTGFSTLSGLSGIASEHVSPAGSEIIGADTSTSTSMTDATSLLESLPITQ